MKVSLAWITPEDQLIPEEAVFDHLAELRDLQVNQRWHEGQLVFPGVGNAEPARLADPLGNLVSQVCLDSIPVLLSGGELDIAYYSSQAKVKLKAEGDQVVLSGDVVPTVYFRRADLLPALVDCAARYATIMRRIHEGNAGWERFFERFDVLVAEAREQVAGKPAG